MLRIFRVFWLIGLSFMVWWSLAGLTTHKADYNHGLLLDSVIIVAIFVMIVTIPVIVLTAERLWPLKTKQ